MDEKEREDLRNKNIKLLDHEYDGIREFDQKLPNWWLISLYATIVFSVIYWVVRHQWMDGEFDFKKLETELAMVEEARLEETLQMLDDDILMAFSRASDWTEAGAATFTQNCVACHGSDLKGENLPGVSLVDAEWLYGNKPTEMYGIVANGSPDLTSGMVAWEGLLGPKKIAEVVAYILSKQE
ncbi:MAG: c-type cytochrome [Opitutales bacterium]|nr:c-type cytochrome [Opitutales bacterium]